MSGIAAVVIESVASMQRWSERTRAAGLRIGFVPTMGDLHEGHLSLMRLALESCDRLVVSIFVNPTQFGPGEDFERYPSQLEADMAKLRELGAAICFTPAVTEIYPPGDETRVLIGWGTDKLCGTRRPGHFDGVCNVVARLLNAVLPHAAFFGQKDAQQILIIQRMVETLHFPVDLGLGTTVREEDGLAVSSRNAYLSAEDRERAPVLFQALEEVGEALSGGERDPARLEELGRECLQRAGVETEYFAAVDPETLDPPERVGEGLLLILCAARVGAARLIDNHVYRIGEDGVNETLLF